MKPGYWQPAFLKPQKSGGDFQVSPPTQDPLGSPRAGDGRGSAIVEVEGGSIRAQAGGRLDRAGGVHHDETSRAAGSTTRSPGSVTAPISSADLACG